MTLTIEPAALSEKSVLRRLLELYLYDFSEFSGTDLDDHGLYGYRYLDHYWTEPERLPFLFRVDGRLAGFALVRRDAGSAAAPHDLDMSEFFVLRRYRRAGIGRQAAQALFARLPGRWQVRQTAENVAAQVFWRRVIAEYTGGRFSESVWDDDGERGPLQTFVSGA